MCVCFCVQKGDGGERAGDSFSCVSDHCGLSRYGGITLCWFIPVVQIADRSFSGGHRSGYLYKFRPHATPTLFSDPWVLRFFVVHDGWLNYFKSERDALFPPRGKIGLSGTYVDYEGVKRRTYYTFKIVDREGNDLIRLSSESRAEAQGWMSALERAGCVRRAGGDDQSVVSPGLSHCSPSTSVVSDTTDTATSSHRGATSGHGRSSGPAAHAQASHPSISDAQGPEYTSDASHTGIRHSYRDRSRDVDLKPSYSLSGRVHRQAVESLLTPTYEFSIRGLCRQEGVLILLFILVTATNFRLILENLIKYGFRFNPYTFLRATLTPKGNVLLLLCWPALAINVLMALIIEKLGTSLLVMETKAEEGDLKKDLTDLKRQRKAKRRASITEYCVFLFNLLNTSLTLLVPCGVIHFTFADPLPSLALTMAAAVLWLKLVSYAHVNSALRKNAREKSVQDRYGLLAAKLERDVSDAGEQESLEWPQNISLQNLGYFVAVPTLCYQMQYPVVHRRFRLRWTLRRIAMLCLSLGLMLFIIEQYIEPTIDNSLRPLQEMDWLRMAERILKLSLPTLYFWLAMFYALFHLWLNILAEVTGFADREFYKEWWNATTLGEYWRLWNMPVHKWMLRHVYFPSLRAGIPKFAAGVICFFVSAIFHELLVGVPLHMLRGWAFWGIMTQVPLIWLTELLKKRFGSEEVGNAIFWVSFCFLGQPLAEILYFHDWRKLHGD